MVASATTRAVPGREDGASSALRGRRDWRDDRGGGDDERMGSDRSPLTYVLSGYDVDAGAVARRYSRRAEELLQALHALEKLVVAERV